MNNLAQDIRETVINLAIVAFAFFVAYRLNEKLKTGRDWTSRWSGVLAVLAFFVTFVLTNEIERWIDKLPASTELDDEL
jgi:hypothetical protein